MTRDCVCGMFTHLSHMAIHHLHHLHYHRLHLLLLAQYFILNLRLGSSANPFFHRPFSFLPDWFHLLSDHLMILFCSAAGFVCMCVRLSRLLVCFRMHFKSLQFTALLSVSQSSAGSTFQPISPDVVSVIWTCCLELTSSNSTQKFFSDGFMHQPPAIGDDRHNVLWSPSGPPALVRLSVIRTCSAWRDISVLSWEFQ